MSNDSQDAMKQDIEIEHGHKCHDPLWLLQEYCSSQKWFFQKHEIIFNLNLAFIVQENITGWDIIRADISQ